MHVPLPRGPVSATLLRVLAGSEEVELLGERAAELAAALDGAPGATVLDSEDLQLSLLVLYELHYQGLDGVDPDWEWSPDLLAVRAVLEGLLERALRDEVSVPPVALPAPTAPAVAAALRPRT